MTKKTIDNKAVELCASILQRVYEETLYIEKGELARYKKLPNRLPEIQEYYKLRKKAIKLGIKALNKIYHKNYELKKDN